MLGGDPAGTCAGEPTCTTSRRPASRGERPRCSSGRLLDTASAGRPAMRRSAVACVPPDDQSPRLPTPHGGLPGVTDGQLHRGRRLDRDYRRRPQLHLHDVRYGVLARRRPARTCVRSVAPGDRRRSGPRLIGLRYRAAWRAPARFAFSEPRGAIDVPPWKRPEGRLGPMGFEFAETMAGHRGVGRRARRKHPFRFEIRAQRAVDAPAPARRARPTIRGHRLRAAARRGVPTPRARSRSGRSASGSSATSCRSPATTASGTSSSARRTSAGSGRSDVHAPCPPRSSTRTTARGDLCDDPVRLPESRLVAVPASASGPL